MDRIWIILAACCAIVAGALLIFGKTDAAFVTGAIGILAWFLNLRRDLSKSARLIENVQNPEEDNPGDRHED